MTTSVAEATPRSFDRRRFHRHALSAPVVVSGEEQHSIRRLTAQACDVSRSGLFVVLREDMFASGEIVNISMEVPPQMQAVFPFSLVSGPCRVVRTAYVMADGTRAQGLGLAFCEERLTLLGAMGSA